MKRPLRLSLLALLVVLALVAAACGTDQDAGGSQAPLAGSEDTSVLPPNPNPNATPPSASGTCFEDEPDCQDTPAPGDVPSDLPPPDAGDIPFTSTGMLVDGGLTVTDALAGEATGVIAVKGFLVVDQQGARLCEALAESYPPQCGGTSIAITDYEEMVSVPLANAQGVNWTDEYVSFLGEIVDGVLVVDPTATG